METKTLFRILLIILGFYALGFQCVNFIFGTTVCKCSNDYILFFCYKIESIFHLFSILIYIWFIVYQIIMIQKRNLDSIHRRTTSKLNKYFIPKNRLKNFVRILLIVFGIGALGFQLYHLVFTTMIKISTFGIKDCFMGEFVPHILSIVICIWFILHKWQSLELK